MTRNQTADLGDQATHAEGAGEHGPFGSMRPAEIETMFYRALRTSGSVSAFETEISDLLLSMGFDTFSYLLIGARDRRLQPPKRIFTTLPEDLLTEYDAKNYHRHDIALDYAFHNRRDIFYSDLQEDLRLASYDTGAKLINQDIHNLYRSFGCYDFYLIPVKRGDRITLFSVGIGDADGYNVTNRDDEGVHQSGQA